LIINSNLFYYNKFIYFFIQFSIDDNDNDNNKTTFTKQNSTNERDGNELPKLVNRNHLIKSAPIPKTTSFAINTIEDNDSSVAESDKKQKNRLMSAESRDKMNKVLNEYNEKMKQAALEIKDLEKNEKNKVSALRKASTRATIRRDKQMVKTKSMDVDKWLEVHKHRNKAAAMKLLNIKQKDIKIEEKINDKKLTPMNINDKDPGEKMKMVKNSRSKYELSDLTVLDRVQRRIRLELEQNMKQIVRQQHQSDFNDIVARIKVFLSETENFKRSTGITIDIDNISNTNKDNSTTRQIIRLYEY
jgi:hypothetical protein